MNATEAAELGREHGHGQATWVFDGNTPMETYVRFLQGHEDGDPEIMDWCPSPLSGEWAGESIQEILGEFEDDDDWQEVADAYENAFTQAWWDECLRVARYHTTVEVAPG